MTFDKQRRQQIIPRIRYTTHAPGKEKKEEKEKRKEKRKGKHWIKKQVLVGKKKRHVANKWIARYGERMGND
jgi:hypothetical protein